tara:strand:- start:1594 stop:2124 length:531 start_codon:yes stop_codon:yes gene_type:complete
MPHEESWLTIGKIVATQGLKGELRVNPLSEFPERFTKPGKRWVQSKKESPTEIKVISGRRIPGKSLFIIRIDEINTKSKAEGLIGKKLLVPISSRPKLSSNEYHLLDLIGLEVNLLPNREHIGIVTDLVKGGNDLLAVKLTEGGEILIPFVKQIVPDVDLENNFINVDPPPGLLDL